MRKELRYLSHVLKIASKTILNMSPGILLTILTLKRMSIWNTLWRQRHDYFPFCFIHIFKKKKKTLWINCISWTRVVMIISRCTLLGKMGWGRKEVNWSCCSQRSNTNKGPLAMTVGHLRNSSCWICPHSSRHMQPQVSIFEMSVKVLNLPHCDTEQKHHCTEWSTLSWHREICFGGPRKASVLQQDLHTVE